MSIKGHGPGCRMGSYSINYILKFEKPIREIEIQIQELRESSAKIDLSKEIKELQKKVDILLKDIYKNLTPWDRVQLSRHPNRPHSLDYIHGFVKDFHELNGDRKFAEDAAIIAGFGYIEERKVAIVGIQKGKKTKEKIKHNFGMPRPEGYRKAIRIMKLASRFNIPIITFVDTPGAYPGIDAEERGQANAIAENLEEMFNIETPIISIIIGEGGSGGALGIAIADKVFMMEYSIYSVISPESCASILWADTKKAESAANTLRLGPHQAKKLKVIDGIILEPPGGAHRRPEKTMLIVKDAIMNALDSFSNYSTKELMNERYKKFRSMGNHTIENRRLK